MSKTLEERVDILLSVGTGEPKKWAKAHGYEEPSETKLELMTKDVLRAEWQRLRNHHIDETHFLFDIIGELVKRLNKCPQCAYNTLVPNHGCLVCPTCGYSKG